MRKIIMIADVSLGKPETIWSREGMNLYLWKNLRKKKRIANRKMAPELDGITPWIFLLPSLLLVSVLVLVLFCDVLRRSFFSAMGGQFAGFRNYRDVFQNEAFQQAAGNTARFTLICIPVLLLFSLLLALLVDALKEKRGIFKTSFLIPMSIPVASVVLLWKVIFHENGLLNHLLGSAGLETVHWLNRESAMTVLMATYIWKNAGYPCGCCCRRPLWGAGRWRIIWRRFLMRQPGMPIGPFCPSIRP